MENTSKAGFPPMPDFEKLQRLYCENPSEFEIVRHRLLQEAAEAQQERHRPGARRLLAHIEAARQQAASPLEAASNAFGMMSASFDDLQRAWCNMAEQRAHLETVLLINRLRRGLH